MIKTKNLNKLIQLRGSNEFVYPEIVQPFEHLNSNLKKSKFDPDELHRCMSICHIISANTLYQQLRLVETSMRNDSVNQEQVHQLQTMLIDLLDELEIFSNNFN